MKKRLIGFGISVLVMTVIMLWLPCVWTGLKAIWAHGGHAFANAFMNDVRAITVDKIVVSLIDSMAAYGVFSLVRRLLKKPPRTTT
ncbi:MAG: hypothetical protein IJ220_01140 [Clostridia bacterium]|nr:hypothetical protein [Clostridia bacterium]